MYLNLPNACIGRGVHLMFHAPRDANGDKSEAARKTTEETRLWMLAQYPLWVRDFINAAGGLSKRQLWMGYAGASKYMRTCGKPGGNRVQTALPMPLGPKLVLIPSDIATAEARRDRYLKEMNARELVLQLQRTTAWTLQDLRAKELAARQVIKDAQAKIDAILRGSNSSESTGAEADAALAILPTAVQLPQEQPRIRKRQNFNLAGNPRTKTRLR
jgi:hypothetical protein